MRIILAALLCWMSSVASARNLDNKPLAIAAGVASACPTGRVCVIGTSSASPYRVGFPGASGNLLDHGRCLAAAAMLGRVRGPLNGDLWYDTSTGIAYVKQAGYSTADWCVIVSGDQRNYHRRIFCLGGTPSLRWISTQTATRSSILQPRLYPAMRQTRGYVDGAISTATATLAPQSRTISTTTPLTGGGDLSADRTLALSYTGTLPFPAARWLWHLLWDERRRQNGTLAAAASADGYWGQMGTHRRRRPL